MPRLRIAALLTLAAVMALAAPAAAQQRTGTTAIDLGGKAYASLVAQGVKLKAKKPARISKGVLRLPVSGGLVTGSAVINHGGSLVLSRKDGRKTRKVTIARLQVRLAGRKSAVAAEIGSKRLTVLTVAGGGASLDAGRGSASVKGAKVKLSAAAAKSIKARLALKRLPVKAFGKATVDALVTPGSGSSSGGGTGGTPGGGGGTGGGTGGGPSSGDPGPEPPGLLRPASAVDVKGATVKWTVRDSWVRYSNTEKPNQALDGAIPDPAIKGDSHPCPDAPGSVTLVYSYTMPFANGWHDPVSGTTAIFTSGGVRFQYLSHGIDFDVKRLEIELTPSGSQVNARVDGRGSTKVTDKRTLLGVVAAPVPLPAPGAPTLMRLSLPAGGGQAVFADFYGPGEGFGCVTVDYTI